MRIRRQSFRASLSEALFSPWTTALVPALTLCSGSIMLWCYLLRKTVAPEVLAYEAYLLSGLGVGSILTYFIILLIDPRSGFGSSLMAMHDRLKKSPWYWATAVTVSVCIGILIMWSRVKWYFSPEVQARETEILTYIGVGAVGVYFIAVTLAAMLLLESELQKKKTQKIFDSAAGILFNGKEASIAMRVETINLFLERLCLRLNADGSREKEVQLLMIECGSEAGKRFSSDFPKIYKKDIRRRDRAKKWKKWNRLMFDEMLSEWFQYESENGLGQIEHEIEDPEEGEPAIISITINHDKGLFWGPGGIAFAHFLDGACAAVIKAMLREHNRQQPGTQLRYYNSVSGGGIIPKPNRTLANQILLEYKMEYEESAPAKTA